MTRAAEVLGPGRKSIAVVGTGISGLLAAERLATGHDVTVFEASDRIGGHTHTVDVEDGRGTVAVDTGFIVCNDRTYPEFLALLDRIGVGLRPSTMSFSVRCDASGVEYCGTSFDTLFAQRRNLLRPSFWSMLRGIRRFHRMAPEFADSDLSLAEVLERVGAGAAFARWYLVPMMAAIWSARPERLMAMPARFFVNFFANHGMLQVRGRPQWRTVLGGSRSYLEPLTRSFASNIRLRSPVADVRRHVDGVLLQVAGESARRFDAAVLATHSDQALAMLSDAGDAERVALGAIPYQRNEVVLHTDTSLMPRHRKAWAAWNYRLPVEPTGSATVTYDMNTLQGLPGPTRWLISLNSSESIAPDKVVRRLVYDHPVFDGDGVRAQGVIPRLNGANRVWFCGAWCGFGFHEDGVKAALRVAADFGIDNGAAA